MIHDKAYEGSQSIVEYIQSIGYDSEEDLANFKGTPGRVSKAIRELILPKQEIKDSLKDILSTCFPMTGDAGIVIQDCVTVSICPHHLLPVFHQIYLGYLPRENGNVLGMSKLIRIADLLSRRAVLQEKLAIDLTAVMFNGHYDDGKLQPAGFPHIETRGSICVMGSLHCCMAARGVRSFSLAREVSLRGVFMHNKGVKEEAFQIIRQFPSTQFPFLR